MSQQSGAAGDLVITMWETYGCGMEEIAQRVSNELGLPLHGQAFSSEDIEAQEAAREDQGLLSKVLGAFSQGTPLVDHGSRADIGERKAMADLVADNTASVMTSAKEGGVILGRNATVILGNRPHTLHVKLDGPRNLRIDRAARLRGIDRARAAKRQESEDKIRADLSIDLYRWDPRDSEPYDLVLNVGAFDDDAIVRFIIEAARLV